MVASALKGRYHFILGFDEAECAYHDGFVCAGSLTQCSGTKIL